jgi:hypothetical protein
MVHALESARDVVVPGGIVLVVHDGRIPPTIELHQGPTHTKAGWLHDHEGFPMVRRSDQAVDGLLDSGQFTLINQNEFVYRTHIDSYDGFLEWLDKQWETSYLPAQTEELIKARFVEGGKDTIVIVHRKARIRSLRVI